MRTPRLLVLVPVGVILACTDPIPVDTLGDPASNVPAPAGVIRGSVLYQGPRPCSTGGHIVGGAVILLFDQDSPPPPNGLANTAVNFAEVPGDVLFANEPRWGGSDTYCPTAHGFEETITASAPFAVSPLAPAAYIIEAFYDTTGDFLPTFKFRNLPEKGDVGGGDIDTADALLPINAGNPDYQPIFLPVGVGIPQPIPAGSPPGAVPLYTMPSEGFLRDNVQVTIGEVLTTTRPYSYAQGVPTVPDTITWSASQGAATDTQNPQVATQSSDVAHTLGDNTGIAGSLDIDNPNYAPILTVPQDILTFGPPQNALGALQAGADLFEYGGTNALGHTAMGFPHLRLLYGVGAASQAVATSDPFDMQIQTFTTTAPQLGGIQQWADAFLPPGGTHYISRQVPEGGLFPNIWPSVILSKLVDDPTHTLDPASLQAQGSATEPVVIIEGLTLSGGTMPTTSGNNDTDSVFNTLSAYALFHTYFNSDGSPIVVTQDHVTTMLRPAAICFDSLFDDSTTDKRGVIVAPYLVNDSADTNGPGDPIIPMTPLVPIDLLDNAPPSKSDLMLVGGPYGRVQITSLVKPPPGYQPPVFGDGGTIVGGTPPAIQGCLPTGRYAINVVYPNGQAWTVPNEAGACTGTATGEGNTNWNANPISCSIQPRPVIRSQGPRAVVEVVASTSGYCKEHPVPAQCLPK